MSELNPSLLRLSTPADTAFELHLPAGSKELFEKRIAEIPVDKRNQWRFHKVVSGETLETIAHDYHVTPAELLFVNQLDAGDDLAGSEGLIIPVAPASSRGRVTLYRVERGDTLVTVADRFDVTVQQLRRWNRLASAKVEPGRRLYVAEPARVTGTRRRSSAASKHKAAAHTTKKSAANTTHRAKSRDHGYSIAEPIRALREKETEFILAFIGIALHAVAIIRAGEQYDGERLSAIQNS